MTDHTITIAESSESYRCSEQETVLAGMEKLGKRGIPVGCRGGGCGVCKVRVATGQYTARKMSRDCVSADEEAAGYALACRIHPVSDLQLSVVGKMARAVLSSSQYGSLACSGNVSAAAEHPNQEK